MGLKGFLFRVASVFFAILLISAACAATVFAEEKKDPELGVLKDRVESLELEVKELRRLLSVGGGRPGRPATPGGYADDEEMQARTALERTIIERGGLLIPPWGVEVAPSFSYIHSSSERVSVNGFTILPVLIVGEVVSERVRRDTYMPALTLRMGLPWDLQIEALVPYSYEREKTITAENEVTTREGEGLNDVEAAVTWQALQERGWIPDLLLGLRWKTTSGRSPFGTEGIALGTGFNGLQGTATVVKLRDPVALIAGVSYTENLAASKPAGRIDPGDTWGVQLAMAMSINPEVSINFGWEQRFTEDTKLEGRSVSGTSVSVGTFRVGSSYLLSKHVSMDFSVGIGLTSDAPDVQTTISFPIRLNR